MSWSATFEVRQPNGLEKTSMSNVEEVPEHLEQYTVAVLAATDLLVSNVVGGPDKEYRITISGHGNPDHEPTAGWANDCVTISVAQI